MFVARKGDGVEWCRKEIEREKKKLDLDIPSTFKKKKKKKKKLSSRPPRPGRHGPHRPRRDHRAPPRRGGDHGAPQDEVPAAGGLVLAGLLGRGALVHPRGADAAARAGRGGGGGDKGAFFVVVVSFVVLLSIILFCSRRVRGGPPAEGLVRHARRRALVGRGAREAPLRAPRRRRQGAAPVVVRGVRRVPPGVPAVPDRGRRAGLGLGALVRAEPRVLGAVRGPAAEAEAGPRGRARGGGPRVRLRAPRPAGTGPQRRDCRGGKEKRERVLSRVPPCMVLFKKKQKEEEKKLIIITRPLFFFKKKKKKLSKSSST